MTTQNEIIKMASDSIDEVYKLRLRVINLERQNAMLVSQLTLAETKAEENWQVVEDVALGTKLECEVCKKYHPCLCDK